MFATIIVFLILLSILVLIHEAGHFIVAKKLGIKVEEFGFGFPPRLFGIKKGETMYSINWLPIGGFVKLYGEDEAGAGRVKLKIENEEAGIKDKKRAFFARSAWQRASVIVAGVAMNALLAVLVFYLFLFISNFRTELTLLDNHSFFFVNQTNYNLDASDVVVTFIIPDSPASKAGIEQFSKILSVNDINVRDTRMMIDLVNKNKGKEIKIVWKELKTNQIKNVLITPRVSPPKNEGPLGIAFFPIAVLSYDTALQKSLSGITHPLNLLSYNFDILGKLIATSIREKNPQAVSQGVAGPIGIYSLVGAIGHIENLKERLLQYINLVGLLSTSLAIFNLLPIPALDGGRLFFVLIEAITGYKVNHKVENFVHQIGFAILLVLLFLVSFKDYLQFFK